MSASARIAQLVRSHYQGDEGAFAEASRTIAASIKIPSIRNGIERDVREGYPRRVKMLEAQRKAPAQGVNPSHGATSRGFHQLIPPPPQAHGLLQELVPQSFDELLLPDELKAQFDQIKLELEYREELQERGLRARDRILLWGTPGNGKTSSAASLAHALGIPAYGVNLARLQGSHLGETSQNLAKLFESLHHNSLVVFDEIDAIGSTRTEDTQAAAKEQNGTVNTMLTLLDRGGAGIIVATTNRLDILDPALVRRFEEVIEVPPPTSAQKSALADRLCARFGVDAIYVDDCPNYDAVTKRCKREARRVVMQEILEAEEKEED